MIWTGFLGTTEITLICCFISADSQRIHNSGLKTVPPIQYQSLQPINNIRENIRDE